MSDSILMPVSGKRRAAKHKPRVTDGIKHPVVVTNKRERTLEQAADTLTTVLIAALDTQAPAKSDAVQDEFTLARIAVQAPEGARGLCGCGAPVTKVWHPSFGSHAKWLHDHAHTGCSMVRNVHTVHPIR